MKIIRNLLINLFCLAMVALLMSPWIPDLFISMVTTEENWHPANIYGNAPMTGTLFFVFFPFYLFIKLTFQFLTKGNIDRSDKWNFINWFLSGLTLFLAIGTVLTLPKARALFNKRVVENITKLKPGMEQKKVYELIFETNLSLIGPLDKKYDFMDESKIYKLNNDTLNQLKSGKNIDFDEISFSLDNESNLFIPKRNQINTDTFIRKYHNDMDAWDTYVLGLKFDQDKKLKSASYSKSVFMEENQGCDILFEIPAVKSRTYPYPCPVDK
jgi:hypothetical protein